MSRDDRKDSEHVNAYQRGFNDAKHIYREPWWVSALPWIVLGLFVAFGGSECALRVVGK